VLKLCCEEWSPCLKFVRVSQGWCPCDAFVTHRGIAHHQFHSCPPLLSCSKQLIKKAFTPTTTTPLLETSNEGLTAGVQEWYEQRRQAYEICSLKFYLSISILTSPSLWAGETTWWGGAPPCRITVLFRRGEEDPSLLPFLTWQGQRMRLQCMWLQPVITHPVFDMARRVTPSLSCHTTPFLTWKGGSPLLVVLVTFSTWQGGLCKGDYRVGSGSEPKYIY